VRIVVVTTKQWLSDGRKGRHDNFSIIFDV